MTKDSLYLAAGFYHSLPPQRVAERIGELLPELSQAVAPDALRYVKRASMIRSDRQRQLTRDAALELPGMIDRDDTEWLDLTHLSDKESALTAGGTAVRIAVRARQHNVESGLALPSRITVLKHVPSDDMPEPRLSALFRVHDLLASAVGYVYAGSHHSYARMMNEVSAIIHQPLAHDPENPVNHIFALGKYRLQFTERLRGAYWGAFLSGSQVATLGGSNRVCQDAPAWSATPLPGGGMFLQATRHYDVTTSPALRSALARLEDYLRPVRVPAPDQFR